MCTPLSESCRLVKGSKQAHTDITSEQRTDTVGCAGTAPDTAHTSADPKDQNKSGTAEEFYAFVS